MVIFHSYVELPEGERLVYEIYANMAHSGKPTDSNAIIFFVDIRSKCHLFVDPYSII